MTRSDLLASALALGGLVAILTPVLSGGDDLSDETVSRANLQTLARADACYAADWNDRQFTAMPDDLGAYAGDCQEYDAQERHEVTVYLGFGRGGVMWAYWGTLGSCDATKPLLFDPSNAIGSSRVPNAVGLHEYQDGGRFYDPVYYAPKDAAAYASASTSFDGEFEFTPPAAPPGTNFVPSTYAFSPAALYHPDVMRALSEGGFQHPDTLDHGYASPSVSQAAHPSLKTRMIEHHWLRTPPALVNPGFDAPFDFFDDTNSPYLFNHGESAAPLATFFDGSISKIRAGQVVRHDQHVIDGGGDGLWSRDTPFGAAGYLGEFSVDGTLAGHHMLTTDGILGRDRLGGDR